MLDGTACVLRTAVFRLLVGAIAYSLTHVLLDRTLTFKFSRIVLIENHGTEARQ